MKRCTECQTIEGESEVKTDEEGHEYTECLDCGSEDSIVYYDEDYGSER